MSRRGALLFVLIGGLVAVARLALFDLTTVHDAEMSPTIQSGDTVLIYRWQRSPNRGELVLLDHPQRRNVRLVRRIVALPGERIGYRDGHLLIQDRPVKQRAIVDLQFRFGARTLLMQLTEEHWNETRYRVMRDPAEARDSARTTIQLRQSYFVLADNRAQGSDSRDFGPVPTSAILGTVGRRLFAGEGDFVGQDSRQGCAAVAAR